MLPYLITLRYVLCCLACLPSLLHAGTKVRRGLGITKDQFRTLQKLKHSEERKFFKKPFKFVPDHTDSGILTRRGLDDLLREAWDPPSDKQYEAMSETIVHHNIDPPRKDLSEQEFMDQLAKEGFTPDQVLHLQDCHDWDNHNWYTGNAEMFIPTSKALHEAITRIRADEKENKCRTEILKYVDDNSDNKLHLEELQELLNHVKDHTGVDEGVLEEGTYQNMIREAGGDVAQGILTVEEFERCMTDYQALGWMPSSVDLHNSLVAKGKIEGQLLLDTDELDARMSDHDAVIAWVDKDQDGRLGREEMNVLLRATQQPISDDEWRKMCEVGEADPKIGFDEAQFDRLQHATLSFSHSWLPSSAEFYGAIKELHGEIALHPDQNEVQMNHHEDHLKEAMAGPPLGDSLSRPILDRVFEQLARKPLTDDEYERLFERVSRGTA